MESETQLITEPRTEKRIKLAIVVGTRPEIIRLSATINLARKYFNTILIHTGQNYDYNLNETFFKDLSIDKPDYYLDCSRENLGKTVGDVISKSYQLFTDLQPDALLILGDTNSCLCAYSAKRLKIPIFHLEAGNRCFDPNVPEEINRKMIDHLSDINMCYMEQARSNLIQEGKTQYVFVVGSPIPEVWNSIKDKTSDILQRYQLEKGKYFVWSSHREENIDNDTNLNSIINSIRQLYDEYKLKIIFSVHPRTRKKLLNVKFHEDIILAEPFGLIDYYTLQKNALCVISDSGTITEESSILGFKAVLLRTSTEHPEGIDAGSIVVGNIKWEDLKLALRMSIELNNGGKIMNYTDTNFSVKVCKIISGYIPIVNKFLWMKSTSD